MTQFGGDHAMICGEFLRRSRQYLSDGDLLQASEKGWGAAAQAAKVYADARSYDYRSHSHFNHILNMLARESGDRMVREWADSANSLHNNFYADVLDAPMVVDRLDNVERFVGLVQDLTGAALLQ